MNIKEMEEKRNALFAKGQELMAKEEHTEEDVQELRSIKEEVQNLDKMMVEAKELRSHSTEEKGEEKEDMNKELEKRAFNDFLRGRETEDLREYRAITNATEASINGDDTAGNGGLGISEIVYNEVIEKMGEEAPVFQAARKFPTMSGQLKVLRESEIAQKGFIGEADDATILQEKFTSVNLTQKRVGAAVQLTRQLINDVAFDVTGYSQKYLTRSLAKTIEKGILVGNGTGSDDAEGFKSIVNDTKVQAREVTTSGDSVTVEELMDIYTKLNPAYLNGAMFVVSRHVFNIMSKLKDGNGQYLVLQNHVGAKPGYTFLGVPVYVSDALDGETNNREIIFGNFEGYGLMVKQGMSMKVINADSRQALAGGELIVMDTYMDGAVVNPDCFVLGKLGA